MQLSSPSGGRTARRVHAENVVSAPGVAHFIDLAQAIWGTIRALANRYRKGCTLKQCHPLARKPHALRARSARRSLRWAASLPAAVFAAWFFLGTAAALLAAPARATLGEDAKTVELDRQQIRATRQIAARSAYSVHVLQAAGGAQVREYVSPAGVVFGVSWGGPTMPNLRQLLGAHFDTFVASPNRQRGGHGHLAVHEGSLVVESGGHMRSFHGRAYLSDALPAGVLADDIQ